jgi:multicomponent Na+:H+ antiporter subunit B
VTVLLSRWFAILLLVFGLYVTFHGTVTPGGGFQGGVIAASGLLLVYLGEGYGVWRDMVRSPMLDLLEGGGALLFTLAAALPLALGRSALENILPLGQFKDLYSGGLMLVVNFGVAMAVTGGFGLLLLEFLEETRDTADETPPGGDS